MTGKIEFFSIIENISSIVTIVGFIVSVAIFFYTRSINKSIKKVKKNFLFYEKGEEYISKLKVYNKELEDKIKKYEKVDKLSIEKCLSNILIEIKKIGDIIPLNCYEEIKRAKKINDKIEKLTISEISLIYSKVYMLPIDDNENKISKIDLSAINIEICKLTELLQHKLLTKKVTNLF